METVGSSARFPIGLKVTHGMARGDGGRSQSKACPRPIRSREKPLVLCSHEDMFFGSG